MRHNPCCAQSVLVCVCLSKNKNVPVYAGLLKNILIRGYNMVKNTTNYTFGGCMACRAPLCPDADCITRQQCYCVAFMKEFFYERRAGTFTDKTHMAHVVQRANASTAVTFFEDNIKNNDTKLHSVDYTVNAKTWGSGTKLKYTASWNKPEKPVRFQDLILLLQQSSEPISFSLDTAYPCCLQCNSIMDSEAMLVDMYMPPDRSEGLIGAASISIKLKNKTISLDEHSTRADLQRYRSTLDAYYLHRCVLPITDNTSNLKNDKRDIYVILSWLCLTITCLIKSKATLSIQRKVKLPHTYVGLLSLLISNFVFILLRCDYGISQEMFSIFHLCYMSELPFCEKAWDRKKYPTVEDWVAQHISSCETPDQQVQSICKQLVYLYALRVRPFVVYFKQDNPKLTQQNKLIIEKYKLFFMTVDEQRYVMQLHRDCVHRQAGNNDVSPFIDEMGIIPILLPIRRNLVFSKAELWQKLDEWIQAHLRMEWNNMKRILPDMTKEQRRLVYNLQYVLDLDTISNGRDMASVIHEYSYDSLLKRVRISPRCSTWKALYRLHSLGISKTDPVQEEREF